MGTGRVLNRPLNRGDTGTGSSVISESGFQKGQGTKKLALGVLTASLQQQVISIRAADQRRTRCIPGLSDHPRGPAGAVAPEACPTQGLLCGGTSGFPEESTASTSSLLPTGGGSQAAFWCW